MNLLETLTQQLLYHLNVIKRRMLKRKEDKSEEPSMDFSVVKTEKDDSETTRV